MIIHKAVININALFFHISRLNTLECVAGSYGKDIFKDPAEWFLESCSIVHSHRQHMMAASFLTSSVTLAIISNFCLSFPKRCTIVSLDGVNLLVSWWAIDLDIFPCGYSHDIHLLYILFGELYAQDFCPVSIWVVCFLPIKFWEFSV